MKRHQLLKAWTGIFLLGTVPFSLSFIAGCGGGNSLTGGSPPPVTGTVTPTVSVSASPSGSVSNAQALSIAIAVTFERRNAVRLRGCKQRKLCIVSG